MLGVSLDTTPEEIKNAWKLKAFETHPDRTGGSEKKFIRMREAYEFLQDRLFPKNTPSMVADDAEGTDDPLEPEAEEAPFDIGTWLHVCNLTVDGASIDGQHRAQVVIMDDEVLIAVYLDVNSQCFSSAGRACLVAQFSKDAPFAFDRDIVHSSKHRSKLEAFWISPVEKRVRLDGSDASIPRPVPSKPHMTSVPRRSEWERILYYGGPWSRP